MSNTAEITVQRTSPEDVGDRQIYMTLDGAPLATLLFGHSFTRTLAPGPHKLTADNTLRKKSVEFAIQAGEQIQFQVTNAPGWGYTYLVGIFGVAPMNVLVERIEPAETASAN